MRGACMVFLMLVCSCFVFATSMNYDILHKKLAKPISNVTYPQPIVNKKDITGVNDDKKPTTDSVSKGDIIKKDKKKFQSPVKVSHLSKKEKAEIHNIAVKDITSSNHSISFYGRLSIGATYNHFHNASSNYSIENYGSYFGIRGDNPIYTDTSIIWQIEQYIDPVVGQAYDNITSSNTIVPVNGSGHINSQSNTFASSETYLGIKTNWGSIKLGHLSGSMRSLMGVVDVFNTGDGINGLSIFSRANRLIPTAIKYDYSLFDTLHFNFLYGFNSNGLKSASSIDSHNNFSSGLAGVYEGGIYDFGLAWQSHGFSLALASMIWQHVGLYATDTGTTSCNGSNCYNKSNYNNAYATHLEFGYDSPIGVFVGLGWQVARGLGWSSWANSGGALGLKVNNSFINVANMINETNAIETNELALSLGYTLHDRWTAKIGYAHGFDWMRGGNLFTVMLGLSDKIPGSSYNQLTGELDVKLTKHTILFANAGYLWVGDTLENISFDSSTKGDVVSGSGIVDGDNSFLTNQASFGIGFAVVF